MIAATLTLRLFLLNFLLLFAAGHFLFLTPGQFFANFLQIFLHFYYVVVAVAAAAAVAAVVADAIAVVVGHLQFLFIFYRQKLFLQTFVVFDLVASNKGIANCL